MVGSNFADGKGNATVYGTYLNTSPVAGTSSTTPACTLNSASSPPAAGSVGPDHLRWLEYQRHGSLPLFGVTASAPIRHDASRQHGRQDHRPVPALHAATDSYNYGALSYAQRQADRYTAGAFLNYDVNENDQRLLGDDVRAEYLVRPVRLERPVRIRRFTSVLQSALYAVRTGRRCARRRPISPPTRRPLRR